MSYTKEHLHKLMDEAGCETLDEYYQLTQQPYSPNPSEVVHAAPGYALVYNKVTLEVSVYEGDYLNSPGDVCILTVNRQGCEFLSSDMRSLVEEVFISHQGS